MVRRILLLAATVAAIAALSATFACGGTKDFNFDAGVDVPLVDAGPCDVYAQTNCPSDLKCTILPSGTPVCGEKGSGTAYQACLHDDECAPGTACVDLEFTGFTLGTHCYPFCALAKQPTDGGTTCPGTDATCIALRFPDGGLQIPEGFCDTASADGG